MSKPRMKVTGAAVAAALMVTVGVTGSAQAAPAKVTNKDLPSLAQVVSVLPALAGAGVMRDGNRKLEGPGTTCKDDKTAKAKSGRIAMYAHTLDMEEPIEGEVQFPRTMAYVQVAELGSARQAANFMKAFQQFAKKCDGKKIDGQRIRSFKVPKLGHQRFAMRATVSFRGDVVFKSTSVYVRKGRTVVFSGIMQDTKVAKKTAVAFAKLALKQAT